MVDNCDSEASRNFGGYCLNQTGGAGGLGEIVCECGGAAALVDLPARPQGCTVLFKGGKQEKNVEM